MQWRCLLGGSCCGNKSTASFSLFMEACGFDVEEELSPISTQNWGRRSMDSNGKWRHEQKKRGGGKFKRF